MTSSNDERKGLLICKDLFFQSQVTAAATQAGCTVEVLFNPSQLSDRLQDGTIRAVFVDISTPGIDITSLVSEAGEIPVVAYGPHVQSGKLRTATEAGCADVMANSRFSAQMVSILRDYCG